MKTLPNGARRPPNQSQSDNRDYEHVKRSCLSHIKSTFRHEKAVRALGAAFAHVRPKTCSNEHFNALLVQIRLNKSEFWCRLITVDETWIHHFAPETKMQSKQWTAKGGPAPKKQKLFFRLGK
ncbi:histone-lysine N-methyltransferase SETMAR [Trichonephila clavipes]|nr:histone-lysine N-methyltransferase SETMAR [Trichonephila clavipes]